MKYNPFVVWTGLVVYFVVFEIVGLLYEWHNHSDAWTLTHYLSRLPMSIKVALLAWLTYHFLWEHPKG